MSLGTWYKSVDYRENMLHCNSKRPATKNLLPWYSHQIDQNSLLREISDKVGTPSGVRGIHQEYPHPLGVFLLVPKEEFYHLSINGLSSWLHKLNERELSTNHTYISDCYSEEGISEIGILAKILHRYSPNSNPCEAYSYLTTIQVRKLPHGFT